MKRLLFTLLVLIGLTSPLAAQTAFNSTTLSAAMSDTSTPFMTLASVTGINAPGTGTSLTLALIDREIVAVRSVNTTSLIVGIQRGAMSTRASSHISGARVLIGAAASGPSAGGWQSYIPSGQCTRSALLFVPWVVTGTAGLNSDVGSTWDCLGVTTAGQWVQTSGFEQPVVGSTVSSATSITPTGTFFAMSGTVNPVSTIAVPAGWAPGLCLAINPTGLWVTDTAGNIRLATTAVVSKVLMECWDGSKWNPSY